MKVGLVQLNVGPDPAVNLPVTRAMVGQAFDAGAMLVCTPEVTGFITTDADQQADLVLDERDDPTLAALCDLARDRAGWIAVGSLAVQTVDADGRFANRSFLIGPDGAVHARYDKIHMFDVTVSETEKYRESARYRPGDRAVLVKAGPAALGLSICYDLRFAQLYRALAQAGAQILLVPSAFSPVTGAAHWEALLRARAIETGCFVIAAAQTGTHTDTPKTRATFGHSMVVDPWGNVILDAGKRTGVHVVDIDLDLVEQARGRIAALTHDRAFTGPL